MTFTSASFGELSAQTVYRICQLRMAVFVVEQACVYQDLDDRDLEPATRHLSYVVDDGVVAAYLRVLAEPTGEARIGRVCVALAYRSSGLAGELMRRAHEQAGDRVVELHAQAYLRGWYERLGYGVIGAEFLDDGIPHVPMRRTPGQ